MNILRDFQRTRTPGECSWMAKAARSPTWETSSASCDLDMIKVPFGSRLKVVILPKRGSSLSDASKQNWHWLGLGCSGMKAMLWTSLSKMHFIWSTYHVSDKSRISGSSVRCSPSVRLHSRATVRPWKKNTQRWAGSVGASRSHRGVCLSAPWAQAELGMPWKTCSAHSQTSKRNKCCVQFWKWDSSLRVGGRHSGEQEK